jgi:hypothetical protein
MSHGFLATNGVNRILIDQEYSNARLVQSGFLPAGETRIECPFQIGADTPLVLIRPSVPESYVGGCGLWPQDEIFEGLPNGIISLSGQHAFSYAIFAVSQGSAVSDGSNFGLIVRRANGAISYDSRHSHPQVRQLLYKAPDYSQYTNYPHTYSVSGYAEMPWLVANSLCMTFLGVGEYSESVGAIMAKVNSSFTQITVDMRDWAATAFVGPGQAGPRTYPVFPSLPGKYAYNPYYGQSTYFGVGYYA